MPLIRHVSFAFVGLLACFLAGCGGTSNGQVVQKFSPQVAPLRAKLAAVAQAIDAEPPVAADAADAKLDPPPVFGADLAARNLAVLNLEQAREPEKELKLVEHLDFGLYTPNDLRDALVYCGPNSPWGPAALRQEGSRLQAQCERALGLKYVLIVRVASHELPTAETDDVYSGGTAKVEGFLLDLASGKIVARTAVVAGPVGKVEFDVVEGKDRRDNPRERMVMAVHSDLVQQARAGLSQKLSELTGGQVDLNARSDSN